MKLCYPDIPTPIVIENEWVSSLVIENQQLLYSFLTDIRSQIQGKPGRAVLSVHDRLVEIAKGIDLFTDFIGFDGNRKGLLSKILQALEKTASNEDNYLRTHRLLAELEYYLNDLSLEQEVELAYDKLSCSNLLKSVGIRVIIDYNKLVERLIAYMDLVQRFEGEKLFLFANLRSFVSDEDMELFLRTVLEHGIRVLLVDGQALPVLSLEKRRIIDGDLCEM